MHVTTLISLFFPPSVCGDDITTLYQCDVRTRNACVIGSFSVANDLQSPAYHVVIYIFNY